VREVDSETRAIVESLLDRKPDGADALRAQLVTAHAYPINDDGTVLRFQLLPDVPAARVGYQQNVAVEAKTKDIDGCPVEVLLHVKHGFIYELEFIRVDGKALQKRPSAKDLTDFVVYQ
jgi:hypothetical protein